MQLALRKLYDHLRWADTKTFAALRDLLAVPPAVGERFMHIAAAEHVWLKRLEAAPAQVAVWPPFTVDACAALLTANHRGFEQLLAVNDSAALLREVSYVNSAGQRFTNSVADILLHVALHGAWHRGQIATLMRQAGLEPVPTDYIAFVRGVAAATQK